MSKMMDEKVRVIENGAGVLLRLEPVNGTVIDHDMTNEELFQLAAEIEQVLRSRIRHLQFDCSRLRETLKKLKEEV